MRVYYNLNKKSEAKKKNNPKIKNCEKFADKKVAQIHAWGSDNGCCSPLTERSRRKPDNAQWEARLRNVFNFLCSHYKMI